MEPGRRTLVALTRPTNEHWIIPEIRVQDTTSSLRQQEQSLVIQAAIPPPPPHDPPREKTGNARRRPVTGERSSTQEYLSRCLLPSIVDTWLENFAIYHSTIAAAFGLGWLVYSRASRMDMQTWTASVMASQHCVSEEPPSVYCIGSSEDMKVTKRPDHSLHGSLTVETSQNYAIGSGEGEIPSPIEDASPIEITTPVDLTTPIEVTSPVEVTSPIEVTFPIGAMTSIAITSPIAITPRIEVVPSKQPQSNSESKTKDQAFATHALLRKHYKFLLPWVSKQPETPIEERSMSSAHSMSENRMADEFRRMSLSHFAELSTAVYCDVRRRDEQVSPASPQPPRPEPWTRNKQNESRMVLCRTVNEQYHRLVMALVLEQARRLAEIRIRIHRRNLVSQR